MAHHYPDSENKTEIQTVEAAAPQESIHPFFEKNDLTFLAMIKPLLSYKGQKLVGFFLDFDNPSQQANTGPLDFMDLFKQFSGKPDNLKDLLPALLNLTKLSEDKSPINPALLTTVLSLLNTMNSKKDN